MAIEYVEIRSAATREMLGIVDTAQSVIWHRRYYGVGDFEVYAPCTAENVALLVKGNYVTRYDDFEVGIIEGVTVTNNPQDGKMIIARGRFAKSVLDRRIIYKRSGYSVSPTILRGSVETAARTLVTENAVDCPFDRGRNIDELAFGPHANTTPTIRDETGAASEKQVTHDNLLTYTDSLLEEYGLGAYCGLNELFQLAYTVFAGVDRSIDNTAGNSPVIFSQDFDNLLSSEYAYDETGLKNTALIGGEGEGTARFHSVVKNASVTGLARREIFVEASSHSKKYRDESDTEQTLTDAEYNAQLKTIGMQEVAKHAITETFNAEIDLTDSTFQYGRDFGLGDIVTVQDVEIGLYVNARMLEITEVQDENGYKIDAVCGK